MRPIPAKAPNMTALEVPGADDMHAVEVTGDPESSGIFSVSLLKDPALSS